uniref:Uncharacterized protein n=1 Tax=Anguilla anguilla TaxID=7936 RepID=A0A0E9PVX3_ANGAN
MCISKSLIKTNSVFPLSYCHNVYSIDFNIQPQAECRTVSKCIPLL